jgi:maleate cis-trans isomerase
VREGTADEFRGALGIIEGKARELAEIGVDLILPQGAPPWMVHGIQKEREVLADWSAKFGRPVRSPGPDQCDAMRALHVHRMVGISYFRGELNDLFAQYFTDAGFDVLAMDGMDVPFDQVGRLSSREVYAHAKAAFRRHTHVDGLYMLGAGWRVLDILETLEQDLEVPVIHSTCTRVWAVQRHFLVRERRPGYGRLLAELPPLSA